MKLFIYLCIILFTIKPCKAQNTPSGYYEIVNVHYSDNVKIENSLKTICIGKIIGCGPNAYTTEYKGKLIRWELDRIYNKYYEPHNSSYYMGGDFGFSGRRGTIYIHNHHNRIKFIDFDVKKVESKKKVLDIDKVLQLTNSEYCIFDTLTMRITTEPINSKFDWITLEIKGLYKDNKLDNNSLRITSVTTYLPPPHPSPGNPKVGLVSNFRTNKFSRPINVQKNKINNGYEFYHCFNGYDLGYNVAFDGNIVYYNITQDDINKAIDECIIKAGLNYRDGIKQPDNTIYVF
ncbi:MAG: hypothetical protein IJA57_09220 [Alistipes sp.]|nr:hypothetical protein [Alistipes sp.]